MSLFQTYSPKVLWTLSLQLANVIFRNPPKMKVEPDSYFKSIMQVHAFIRRDLNGTFENMPTVDTPTTIDQIHLSLYELDTMLFNDSATFEKSIEGCCLYTKYLEKRLNKSKGCTIL